MDQDLLPNSTDVHQPMIAKPELLTFWRANTASGTKAICVFLAWLILGPSIALRAQADEPTTALRTARPQLNIISQPGWDRIDRSVEKALKWLLTQQDKNGAFRTPGPHETAITALSVMALLSNGHTPGAGAEGKAIEAGIDFVLSCQQPNGQISSSPEHTHSTYHHAIAGVMLGECYGMTSEDRSQRIERAIRKSLAWTAKLQYQGNGKRPQDKGGWRYVNDPKVPTPQADLSVTSWMIMSYRSARNAEFEVSVDSLNNAMEFVRRCHIPAEGGFRYCPPPGDYPARRCNWAMTGAGITTLALAGETNDVRTITAGDWLLAHPMKAYGRIERMADRYHYAAYYCSLGSFLVGGDCWKDFYPRVSDQLLDAQLPAGNWPNETGEDQPVSSVYSTAMSVMTLTIPYQLLPIYQR